MKDIGECQGDGAGAYNGDLELRRGHDEWLSGVYAFRSLVWMLGCVVVQLKC